MEYPWLAPPNPAGADALAALPGPAPCVAADKDYAAPKPLSLGPLTIAVLPSADSETASQTFPPFSGLRLRRHRRPGS
jgi:hypothetical protein